jgi:hypothetical protein
LIYYLYLYLSSATLYNSCQPMAGAYQHVYNS